MRRCLRSVITRPVVFLSDPGRGERAELSVEAEAPESGALSGPDLQRARRLSGGGSAGRTRPRLQSGSESVRRRAGARGSAAASRRPAGVRARLSARQLCGAQAAGPVLRAAGRSGRRQARRLQSGQTPG